MNESRNETKARLKQEGRWEAFVKARGEHVKKGYHANDAHLKALAEFQPLDGTSATFRGETAYTVVPSPPNRGRAATRNLRRDMDWVYEHMHLALAVGAPSESAAELHRLVTMHDKSKLDFLDSYWKIRLAKSEEEVQTARKVADEKYLARLESFMHEQGDRCPQCGFDYRKTHADPGEGGQGPEGEPPAPAQDVPTAL